MASDSDALEFLAELHDAELIALELRWAEGDVRLGFELDDGRSRLSLEGSDPRPLERAAGPRTIVVTGLRALRLTRAFEWGPSVYVDGATWLEGTLTIELQSGDTIATEGSRLELP